MYFRNLPKNREPRRKQSGFGLPIAIFILVIMALIGAAAVSITQTSQDSLSNEVLSTRAFYSAESGAQYALGQLFTLDGSAATCSAPYASISLSSTGLAGCSATATCSSATIASKTYYTITSTGVCSFGSISATRQIEVMATLP